ncbi:hypothetical protein AO501_14205 [Mycobacterium gordonae]|uniref:Lipoprotein n=1 Tax=Mycobacterium gordonae TaxID=1778 RepID=A0A0Q2LTT3_MYCGO|nr:MULTISPECIES: hypothetical protein [Mycobacterium]KQH79218.1 hypothetical protein AO501_14205 [Mycobacterium gordonae]MDP7727016.1 hypothetical protein [Mycobacterium sp. TY813]
MRISAMTRRGAKSTAWCALGCAVAVLAGCSSSKAPATAPSSNTTAPAGYQVPRNVMFSEHWATTPAVDLMSPEGTYLRAYIEADHVADYNVDRADGSYPGFAKAARDRSYHWTGTGFPAKGFHTNWVHELTAAPDGSATAVVCYAGEVSVSGSFPDNYGIFKRTLTFQRVGQAPPANQKGPARAPLVSVFGDWYTSTFTTQYPLMDPDCATDPPPVDKSPVSTPGWPDTPGV